MKRFRRGPPFLEWAFRPFWGVRAARILKDVPTAAVTVTEARDRAGRISVLDLTLLSKTQFVNSCLLLSVHQTQPADAPDTNTDAARWKHHHDDGQWTPLGRRHTCCEQALSILFKESERAGSGARSQLSRFDQPKPGQGPTPSSRGHLGQKDSFGCGVWA